MIDDFWIKTLSIIVATIIGWISHEVSGYFFLRNTIRAYLLIVIPSLIRESRVSLDQMESYYANKIQVGKPVDIAPTYINEALDLIACVKVETDIPHPLIHIFRLKLMQLFQYVIDSLVFWYIFEVAYIS